MRWSELPDALATLIWLVLVVLGVLVEIGLVVLLLYAITGIRLWGPT